MNCCNDFGQCICETGGKPTGRSCEELGVCKREKALAIEPVAPCTHDCDEGRRCTCAPPKQASILFAPGTVECYKVHFFGSPAQRRELVRWSKGAALFLAVVVLAAFCAGVVSGALR